MSLVQKRLETSSESRVKFDHELIDFVYKNGIHHTRDIIVGLAVSIVALILMAVFVGLSDKAERYRSAGFLGAFLALAALGVVGSAGLLGWFHLKKGQSQFAQASIMDIDSLYQQVLDEYVSQSPFAEYLKTHKQDKDCIGRALVHQRLGQ